MPGETKFFGKYRGTVIDNIDPMQTGRLQAQVPDVSNVPLAWAMPCLPFAGIQSGFYAVPAIGSQVWIEFEQGQPRLPDLGRLLLGLRRRCAGARASRSSRPAADNRPDHRPEHAADQRCARAHRRHPAQVVDRRADLGVRRRHHDQQRTRRHDHHERPGGHCQPGRPGGDLSMPGLLLDKSVRTLGEAMTRS